MVNRTRYVTTGQPPTIGRYSMLCILLLAINRGGLRKNELQNRKTAIGAFFCMGKNWMETGPIIVNGQILPSKNGFENCHF